MGPPSCRLETSSDPDSNSIEVRRAEGGAEFEAALHRIELERDLVQRRLRTYQTGCRTSTDVVRPRGCGPLEVEIRRLLDEVDRSVATAEEEARRSIHRALLFGPRPGLALRRE